MRMGRVARISLALIAVFMLPAGVQAAFMPESFYEDFPFGRGWIAAEGGPYNEHLIRDVGFLFIAMIIVTAWAVWRRTDPRPIAIAWLVQGVGHLVYHVGHLDGYDGIDKVGMVMSLATIPVLAGIALWDGMRGAPRR